MSHRMSSFAITRAAAVAALAGALPAAAQDRGIESREFIPPPTPASVVCGAGWMFADLDRPAPRLEGIGDAHMEITTTKPEAQALFDQGLRLVFAFNHEEAWRTFKEAAQVDPDCAMAYWGIAYTLGGNYNVPGSTERLETAAKAIALAKNLRMNASPKERALIDAMSARYALPVPEAEEDRKALDRAYADAMTKVAREYPGDDHIQTFYAESLMMLRPWQLFDERGKPAEGTQTILDTLDLVVARSPSHTGANHLAIHAWEASETPERAMGSADRLAQLAPNAGHLVHMPSHIYIRTGHYHKSAEANRAAIAADDSYLDKVGGGYIYGGLYAPHNWHFLVTSDMMIGIADEAIEMAREMTRRGSTNIPALREAPGADFVISQTWCMMARFGRWNDVLAEPAPPEGFAYAKASWHFARGRAYVGLGQLDKAKEELAVLEDRDNWIPEEAMGPYGTDPARPVAAVAADVLAGVIAHAEGRSEEAVERLKSAVAKEDKLRYGEPPTWHAPSRQTLGAVLIRMAEDARASGDTGKAAEYAAKAEKAFHEDMKRHPNNGWSLYGVAEALKLQNKPEAKAAAAKFKDVWRGEGKGGGAAPQWAWF